MSNFCLVSKMYNIIYNPKAARGKSEYYLNELLKVFTVNNIPYTLYETEYQGHATQIAQMIEKKGFDKIIIVGGDGTIFEVLNGCQNLNNMNFGVIPAGTGNDTARMLKTNKNPINSINKVLNGTQVKIDCGCVNDKEIFTLFASYGIVLNIINDCKKIKKKKKIHYYLALLKNIFTYIPKTYKIKFNETESKFIVADFISIQNSNRVGGGMSVCSYANPQDGYLDLVIIIYTGIFRRLLNFVFMLSNNLHLQPNVLMYKVKNTTIESPMDNVCCMDGEIIITNQLEVKVKQKSVNFFI